MAKESNYTTNVCHNLLKERRKEATLKRSEFLQMESTRKYIYISIAPNPIKLFLQRHKAAILKPLTCLLGIQELSNMWKMVRAWFLTAEVGGDR